MVELQNLKKQKIHNVNTMLKKHILEADID